MKKKNYVYKLCATNRIYADRDSAVQAAFDHIKQVNWTLPYPAKAISSPVLIKVHGGYRVVCFDEVGRMLSRKLDVFVAEKKKRVVGYKPMMARHELETTGGARPIYRNVDDEDEGLCDFDCEDCVRKSSCDDAFDFDEDEDEDECEYED